MSKAIKQLGLIVVCAVVLAAITSRAAADVALVRNGAPAATIVLSAEASKQERLAANELQEHLKLMSGAELAIVTDPAEAQGMPIYIGAAAPKPALEELRDRSTDEGVLRVQVTPRMIQLVGNSDAATLYATYELLEQLGVRWLIPGEIGRDVPRNQNVTIKEQNLISVPGFRGRILQAIGDRDWARRQRLGGLSAGGHGLGPKFSREKEPELFYQLEGGRVSRQEKVSEPEVLRRVIAHWRKRLEANPEMEYLNIGPHDGSGFGVDPWDADDFDPILGRQATTDRYVKFFNKVLEDIQADYPDVGLAFYAYTQEMRPPVREQPNPKLLPMLAAIALDRFHSIENPISWEKQYLRTVIEGWQELGVSMYFRGYLFNLADHGLPFSMIDIVRDEWPYYHDKGFIGMRSECIPNWSYHAPALYLAARLYWTPDADADVILDEWFTRMYGPAASDMREHFDIIENAYIHSEYYTGNVFDVPKVLTPAVRQTMGETLRRAERAAGSNNKHAQRVHLVRLGYDYGEANFRMMDAFARNDFIEAEQHRAAIEAMIPTLTAHDPPVISPRTHVGYFNRFWSRNVRDAYERVTEKGEKVAALPDEWLLFLDPNEVGEQLLLFRPENGTQPWMKVRTVTQSASNQGMRYYDAAGWYRTSVDVPAKFDGRAMHLWLGGLDDTCKVWVNGEPVEQLQRGAAPIGRAFIFDVGDAVRPGKANVIVIMAIDKAVNELGTFGLTGPAMLYAPNDEAPAD